MTLVTRPTLGVVLTELGPEAKLLVGPEGALSRPVVGASIWTGRAPVSDPQVALVVTWIDRPADLSALLEALTDEPSRILVLTAPCPVPARELTKLAGQHVILHAGGTVDPAHVVLDISRAAEVPDESRTRRLATLQRSLTQALSDPEPLPALLARLKSASNASIALVDKRGRAMHSTGPIPLALLFDSVTRTGADSQMLDVEGWTGVADKVHDPDRPSEYIGWLIMASRRSGFPDQYSVAAIHVATALVEACHRMTLVARQQERAIKSATLEEALALRPIPDDPDLAGRIASFGLDLSQGVRMAVLRPLRASPSTRGLPALEAVGEEISQRLSDAAIPHLISRRERHLVLAMQCSPAMLRRAVVAVDSVREIQVGVGRIATRVGELPDSHRDARLAMQTLQRQRRGPRMLAYEDFDFAMRLFAEVGIERMNDWASTFLRPIADRPVLLDGLREYFKHSQNMNAAADALNIHHNSLRYRLAKIEEALDLSLRDPGALASLFLATTALEHETGSAGTLPSGRGGSDQPADVEAPRQVQAHGDPFPHRLGVVLSPERS